MARSAVDVLSKSQLFLRKQYKELTTPMQRRLVKLGLLALASLLVIFAIGIYALGWQDNATYTVSRIIPYPAAIVNKKVIRFSEYAKRRRLIKQIYSQSGISDSQINRLAIGQLISSVVVEKWADEHGITLSREQFDKAKQLAKGEGPSLSDDVLKYNLLTNKIIASLKEPYGVWQRRELTEAKTWYLLPQLRK